MEKQKTIARELSLSGIGLHTASRVNVVFKPAPEDSGINFVRVDLPEKPVIKVGVESLLVSGSSLRRTSIGCGGVEIQTIEHLMAALAGIEIDNIRIELDNVEVPGLDGSSLNFLEMLHGAGIAEQEKERRYFAVRDPIVVEEDSA